MHFTLLTQKESWEFKKLLWYYIHSTNKEGQRSNFCTILWFVYQESEKGLNPLSLALCTFFWEFSLSKRWGSWNWLMFRGLMSLLLRSLLWEREPRSWLSKVQKTLGLPLNRTSFSSSILVRIAIAIAFILLQLFIFPTRNVVWYKLNYKHVWVPGVKCGMFLVNLVVPILKILCWWHFVWGTVIIVWTVLWVSLVWLICVIELVQDPAWN